MLSDMTDGAHGHSASVSVPRRVAPAPVRRLVGRFRSLLVVVLGGAAVAVVLGFVDFANRVTGALPPADPRADGIVVLTGGSARIDRALQLLAAGRGDRLLISGVNPSVTRKVLAGSLDGELRAIIRCCVDLDRKAEDTVGNAFETRKWADRQGFSSLIIVTSDYHMPRSMAELAETMPDKRLVPFPISNPDLHLGDWWRDPDAFAILVREYGKLLLTEGRIMIAPAPVTRL